MNIESKQGRVVELHGQRVVISTADKMIDAVLAGKLKHGEKQITPVAVGDYVFYDLKADGLASVEEVIQRKKYLSRPAVERDGLIQVIVSNIDRIIILVSLKNPRFNSGIVDRFLIAAFKEDIQPVIVLNKIDLGDTSDVDPYFQAWKNISCDTFYTSAKSGEGIEDLKSLMNAGTSVIAGHSGVGKSSILNAIAPKLNLKTKAVSSYTQKGVHTTSRVSLFQISDKGWVADTPGLKVLGHSDITKDNLKDFYPEFNNPETPCRFDDCNHINEPDCAIKQSIENNDSQIAKFRYENYIRIHDSIKDLRY